MNIYKPFYESDRYDDVTIPYEMHKHEFCYRLDLLDLRERTAYTETKDWTNQELELLIHYFNELCSISEIALFMQRTEPDVMHKIEELDLYHCKHPLANIGLYSTERLQDTLKKISHTFLPATEPES